MCDNIKENIRKATGPLEEYIKAFDPYLEILRSNPEDYCKAMEAEENPKDIETINEEIAEVSSHI